MITIDDIKLLLFTLIEIVGLAWIISYILGFIPSFLLSIIRKLPNNSPVTNDEQIYTADLESNLDKSELGMKTLIDRWRV